MVAWLAVVGAVAMERLVELVVARRNAAWARARGGREWGREHYPYMVALHVALLAGCVLEPWLLHRPTLPWMLAIVLGAQALRWWCIATLGSRWNTRVLVVPGLDRIHAGPYLYLRHPNYVAVALEGAALPLAHGAWITAAAFTMLNAVLMSIRIPVEEAALQWAQASRP